MATPTDQAPLHALIGRLYQAALDDGLWTAFLSDPLQLVRRPSLARVRIVRLDQTDQRRPRDHRVHLGQEPLPARRLALPVPGRRGERLLLFHASPPAPVLPRAGDFCRDSLARRPGSSAGGAAPRSLVRAPGGLG